MTKWWAGIVLGVGLIASGLAFVACYPNSGPTPSCAADPWQPDCYPPVHDATRTDGGMDR